MPRGEVRGGHSYYRNKEVIIALSGGFEVLLDDGKEMKKFSINRSYFGLYVSNGIWRYTDNFSTNALALVVASKNYEENDYERNYESFKKGRV